MKRELGSHSLHISPLVFGAWAIGGWWWGPTDDKVAIEAIRTGIDAGITAIDTAPVYGFGHSEEVVGRAIKGRREQAFIMTKFGLNWQSDEGKLYFSTTDGNGQERTITKLCTPKAIIAECEASLRRLGIDCIDLYQLHWPSREVEPETIMQTLTELQRQGKIAGIGVSNCKPEWLARAAAAGQLSSHQPKWSWLFRKNETASIAWSHKHKVGATVYSPLEQGLLTGKVTVDRVFEQGDLRTTMPTFRKENITRVQGLLDGIRPIAAAHDCTLAQLTLASTIARPGITAAIVGARTPGQVIENARAMHITLSQDELDQIAATFSGTN